MHAGMKVGEAESLGSAKPLQMTAMQCEKKEEEMELEREGETSTHELWTLSQQNQRG